MRSPLTRVHLTKVENRVRDLETLIHELLPDADVDKLLAKQVPRCSGTPKTHSGDASPATPSPFASTSMSQTASSSDHRENSNDFQPEIPEDDVPEDAIYGFDWVEEDADIALNDGMAALSVNPSNKGYFGVASSAGVLRALKIPKQSTDEEHSPSSQGPDSRSNSKVLDMDSTLSLTAKYLTNEFIESYFNNYHTSYPFIHKETFLAQYCDEIPTPTNEIWQILLNTVLALGAWCLHGESSNVDLYYYQNAKSYLSSYVFESGSIPLLQALTLLSNYAQKRNKPNTGWNYLGLAVRMAMGLGLYKEFSNWTCSKNQLQLEMRRRLWWGLYIFDGGAAITFGRPVNLPVDQMMDINEVSNINDDDYLKNNDLKKELVPVDYPTIYSGLIWQAKFTIISTEIYNRLISKPAPTASECLQLNNRITDFIQQLPPYFSENSLVAENSTKIPNSPKTPEWLAFARYRLIWRYKNLQIIMFRPFIWQRVIGIKNPEILEMAKSPEGKQARNICLTRAHETILSISNFIYNHEMSVIASWYATFFLFHASLISCVCLCSEPNSNHATGWKNDIILSKKILAKLSQVNSLADKFVAVIDNLCGKYLDETSLQNIFQEFKDIPQDDPKVADQSNPTTDTISQEQLEQQLKTKVDDFLPDFDFNDISANNNMSEFLNLLPADIANIEVHNNNNSQFPVKTEEEDFQGFNINYNNNDVMLNSEADMANRLSSERSQSQQEKSDFYDLVFNEDQIDWNLK